MEHRHDVQPGLVDSKCFRHTVNGVRGADDVYEGVNSSTGLRPDLLDCGHFA